MEHIALGARENWGQELPSVLFHHDRRHHLYAIGKTGRCKTTLPRTVSACKNGLRRNCPQCTDRSHDGSHQLRTRWAHHPPYLGEQGCHVTVNDVVLPGNLRLRLRDFPLRLHLFRSPLLQVLRCLLLCQPGHC